MAEAQSRIDEAFADLRQVDAESGGALQFTAEGLAKRQRQHYHLRTLSGEWQALTRQMASLTPEAAARQAEHLVADVRVMITHAGDTSGLILDPDLDSYYLMDATLVGLPQTLGRLASIQNAGDRMLGPKPPTEAERTELAVAAALLAESDRDRIAADVQTSLTEDQNFYGVSESLQRSLPPALKEYTGATDTVLLQMKGLHTGAAVNRAEYHAAVSAARRASLKLWNLSVQELDHLLDRRIGYYTRLRWQALLATFSL